ncbi:hypothetical protein [Pedobacter sp. UYP1]|uniref:hypothetical protein n=1 Tax=Pedobacter sp. UYP1 TaxID=1756396 RepID=UPI003394657D
MKKIKLVLTIGLLALITSCSKSKDEVVAPTRPPVVIPPDPVKTADVYVAGWKYNSQLAPVAAFWKNGVQTELTDGTTNLARANSIYVSSTDDVYVAGEDGMKSVLWKNGIAKVLWGGSSVANSVFVSGSDVYVAGAIDRKAAIWKNGVVVKLADGPYFSVAYSVFVSGTDVYAAGYSYPDGHRTVATLWKNGVATSLTDGSKYAVAKAVFVSGNDVYVLSNENINPDVSQLPGYLTFGSSPAIKSVVKIWKNGVTENLTDGTKQAIGNSLFVNGIDTYVSGYENDNTTCTAILWINKIVVNAGSGLYQKTGIINANSVFVHKDDLYVVVNEGLTSKTWKNMFNVKEINKEDGGATALSVFVK